MILAVSASSLALWTGRRWRSSHDVPKSRLMPRLAKMAEKRARSEHQVRSAARARPRPAPTQSPSTLATTGIGQVWTLSTTSASTRMPSSMLPIGPSEAPAPAPLRSAPLQNSPLAPVSTTARAPEYRMSWKMAPMATHMSPVHPFLDSGLSMVTVTT